MKKQRFDPSLNSIINLFNETYTFPPHPSVPRTIFAQKAGKSDVYQLKNEKGELFAFKVFFPKFRNDEIAESGRHLASYQNLSGMQAANRRVILPDNPIVETYSDLKYAVLMPWLKGFTWFDVLQGAKEKKNYINRQHALFLCRKFLEIMSGFERLGIAHTDIAAGNVAVDFNNLEVQLLDLEDIYFPNAPVPKKQNVGSDGYRHFTCETEAGQTYWCSEGDRYATAILAAEILILSDPIFAAKAKETGFFAGHKIEKKINPNYNSDPEANNRYQEVKGFLSTIAPKFAKYFDDVWNSATLNECPPIEVLSSAIQESIRTNHVSGNALVPFAQSSAYNSAPSNIFVTWNNKNSKDQPKAQPPIEDSASNPFWNNQNNNRQNTNPPSYNFVPPVYPSKSNYYYPLLGVSIAFAVLGLMIAGVSLGIVGFSLSQTLNDSPNYSNVNNSSANYNSPSNNANYGTNSYSSNGNMMANSYSSNGNMMNSSANRMMSNANYSSNMMSNMSNANYYSSNMAANTKANSNNKQNNITVIDGYESNGDVINADAPLRAAPEYGSRIKDTITKGRIYVHINSQEGPWYLVTLPSGEDGWVHGNDLSLDNNF